MSKIYLLVEGNGWQQFDLTDTAELSKRKIVIHPNAIIDDNAIIGDSARVGYNAIIGNNARVGDSARVGEASTVKSFCISGTKHLVQWWGQDIIQIGCHQRSIADWLESYTAIGRREGYSL